MLHCHVVIVSAIETTAITSNEIRMNAPLTLSEVETCVCVCVCVRYQNNVDGKT
jgi:hypothetical protein